MSTINSKRRHFSHPEIELEAPRKKEEAIEDSRELGRDHASRSLPPVDSGKLNSYIGLILTWFSNIMTYVGQQLQSSTLYTEANAVIASKDKEIINLGHKIRDAKRLLKVKQQAFEKVRKVKSLLSRWVFGFVLLFFIFASECYWNLKAFEEVGETRLEALLISVGIALGLHTFAYFLPIYINKVRDRKIRNLAWALIGVFMIIIFTGIAIVRQAAGMDLSPFFFVAINILLFVASMFIIHGLLPIREERNERDQWEKIRTEYKTAEELVRSLESELSSVEKEKYEALQELAALVAYAEDWSRRIESWKNEAVEIYKQENLYGRPGAGGAPSCFTDSIPQLTPISFSVNSHNSQKDETR